MDKINALSLFDGMSCGQVALERAGIKVENYYASEIDKFAIEVTQSNFPNTIQLGCITEIDVKKLPKIDIVFGGSPCQGFSFSGKQLNFNDPRSKLFFNFVDIVSALKERNPDLLFLLENVKMKKDYQDVITEMLGVEPMEINSELVSAQNRRRLYWTNIEVDSMPNDKEIVLDEILQDDFDEKYLISKKHNKRIETSTDVKKRFTAINPEKALCMTARQFANWKGTYVKTPKGLRKLTPVECERLQNLPDEYTQAASDSQRYKMIGNGWTVDIVAHIFKHI